MRELSTCPFCADTRTMSTAAGSRGAFKTAGRKGLTSDRPARCLGQAPAPIPALRGGRAHTLGIGLIGKPLWHKPVAWGRHQPQCRQHLDPGPFQRAGHCPQLGRGRKPAAAQHPD